MTNKKLINLFKKNQLLQFQLNLLVEHKLNIQNNYQKIINAKAFKLWQIFQKIKKNPNLIKKGLNILLKKGPKNLINLFKINQSVSEKLSQINDQYQIWFKTHKPTKKILLKQKILQKKFLYRPKISIITPVYNPSKEWLKSCIESVINQTYDNWELCLADDASTKLYIKKILQKYSKQDERIKVIYRPKNGHISRASNSALKIATGEFIALLDHDDDLAPHALFKIVKVLNKNKKIDFIYTDEDKVELNGKHVDPFFKPNWSPDMLLSTNYLCHLCVIRKKLIDEVGEFRIGYEGSQDYDLFLRITEKTKNIYHIPDILYSWRKVPGSTATVYSTKNYCDQASIKAIQDAMIRRKLETTVKKGLVDGTFRVKYKIKGKPLVSIIIPTKDKVDFLKRCIKSILSKSTYTNYEIIIVDTGSNESDTKKYYKTLKKITKIKFLNWQRIFNYSSVNNFAVKKAKGEYILLLNNDTEVITPDWIESMLEHAQRKEIGAVGVKLLYPNNTIQHVGVILGIKGGKIDRGIAGHALKTYPDTPLHQSLLNSKDIVRDYSAVTAACLMVSKKKYNEVGGLDEKFRIAFNDVDFNLKLMKKGYLNLYTPYTKLYHHESISVGTPENGTRDLNEFSKEITLMIKKWDKLLQNDPFYNKNLTLEHENFYLNTDLNDQK